MRVHHVNCGTLCPAGFGLVGVFPPENRMICHVLIIETERSGLVVVDTGFGTADIKSPQLLGPGFAKITRPSLREEETVVAHVLRLGFKKEDVRHIIPTHLDLDHAGGLPDFPNAKVHAYAPEVRAMERGATLPERNRYRPHHFAHGPDWVRYEVKGEPYRGLECVRELEGLPPEILLLPTVGHTRGHVAVIFELGERTLVHAGDAYFHSAEVKGDRAKAPWPLRAFQRIVAIDDRARLVNQERLRELAADPNIDMFCAHDPDEGKAHAIQ